VKNARIVAGLLLAALGVVLVFLPLEVAAALGRPAETPSQLINLRASWGGALLGLGAFLAVRGALRPWGVTVATLLLCSMAGIAAGRGVGFALDGSPDTLQWVWMVAEVALVLGSLAYLRTRT